MSLSKIVIMRGIPGSGKSYYAKKLHEQTAGVTVSADTYFYDGEGNYNFDASKLPQAHGACLREYLRFVQAAPHQEIHPVGTLIVDNTNTRLWEISPYVTIAEAYEIPYEIVHVVCPVEVALERNVHSVPEQTIRDQAERFEEPLPWWNSRTVSGVEK